MLKVSKIETKWNPGAQKKIKTACSNMVFLTAKKTLDLTYPTIPLSDRVNRGNLRRSSMAYGVQGSGLNYTIGSNTYYASDVWNYDDARTHWTTSGTHSQWYLRTWKKDGYRILKQAIERYYLK